MARLFNPSPGLREVAPNRWDWILLPLVLVVLVLAAYGAMQMSRPFVVGEALPIALDPVNLPYYLMRTILRMFIALGFSLLFAFVFAALAAKYRAAEKAMIPLLDVLQSVPILGFRPSPSRRSSRCSRATCWGGMRGDLRHLHLPGVEHGAEPVPVVPHRAAGAERGCADLPSLGLAALLAP